MSRDFTFEFSGADMSAAFSDVSPCVLELANVQPDDMLKLSASTLIRRVDGTVWKVEGDRLVRVWDDDPVEV